MHGGCINRRSSVGNTPEPWLCAFRGFQHRNHFSQKGLPCKACGPQDNRCPNRKGAGGKGFAWFRDNWITFPGRNRTIHLSVPTDNDTVNRQVLTGGDKQDHAWYHCIQWHPIAASILCDHGRAAGCHTPQTGNSTARPFTHHMVQHTPDQQEEQQCYRRIEIGIFAMIGSLIHTHPQCQYDGQRDRNIHRQMSGL